MNRMTDGLQTDGLRVVTWNANGVLHKKHELADFVATHDPQILLLTETHLLPIQTFKLPNFTTYRTDRLLRRGGGTAILVKNTLLHYNIQAPTLKTLEATTIQIQINSTHYRFASCYKSPAETLYPPDLDALLDFGGPCIIGGDFNCKDPLWNSRVPNVNGKILKSYAIKNNIIIHGPFQPTFFPKGVGRPDVLDIFITKNTSFNLITYSIPELSSDHNPVMAELHRTLQVPQTRRHIVSWKGVTNTLTNKHLCTDQILTTEDLDTAVEELTNTIQDAIGKNTREVDRDTTTHLSLPPDIIQLIKDRNYFRKKYQLTLDPAYKKIMNRFTNRVKKEIIKFKNKKWTDKIEGLSLTDNTAWEFTRVIRGNRARPRIPPIQGVLGMTYTDKDKTEIFADSLELQFRAPETNDGTDEIEDFTDEFLSNNTQDTLSPTTGPGIKEIIEKLPVKKAPGPDGISNKALQSLPPNTIETIANIYNHAIRLEHFPTSWKHAKVILLPKPKKNRSLPQNYRPISLLNTLSKLFEKILISHLRTDLQTHNILMPEQFGFREHYSTIHQLSRLTKHITQNFNNHSHTGAVFLDIAKAFDTVWHTGLLYKMANLDINTKLIKLISSFLENRTFSVHINDKHSTTRIVEAGVPQGSVLAPVLFLLYINDIPTNPQTQIAVFADDTAIYTSNRNTNYIYRQLQRHLDSLETWFDFWRLKVNVDKSSAVLFSKRRPRAPPPLELFGERVEWTGGTKYLGVTLDRRLTWAEHTTHIQQTAIQRLGQLGPLINKKSKLKKQIQLTLYKGVVLPTLLYACEVWGYAAHTHIHKLQVVQNKALRIISGAPWYVRGARLHTDYKIETIKEIVFNRTLKFYNKTNKSTNELIKTLGDETNTKHKRHKTPLTTLQHSTTTLGSGAQQQQKKKK